MKAWQGPSLIDGTEICLFLSGLRRRGTNRKLGDMVQAWVMPADEPPQFAVKTGRDVAVCGGCERRPLQGSARPEFAPPHGDEVLCPGDCQRCEACRPVFTASWGGRRNVYIDEHGNQGRCYVVTFQGPKRVWECYSQQEPSQRRACAAVISANKTVRVGAWGDPTAIPLEVWVRIIPTKLWGPGYTKRWAACPQEWNRYLMASVESLAAAREAQERGWRTYRVGGRL